MPIAPFPESKWRRICQIALFETDPTLLTGRIAEAREAIAAREKEPDGVPFEERRDMIRAKRRLANLEERART